MNSDECEWVEHWWPAPAKLNLMLNIVSQRADGYHQLQTVFQLVAMSDWLNFDIRQDGIIDFSCSRGEIANADNLVVRAAQLLKDHSNKPSLGANIELKKILPLGAGLGGGSSDAATALVVLNAMWGLDYSADELARIALKLGADVPVFVLGQSAWAEGVGEQLQVLDLPEQWYVVVNSDVHCSTKEVFAHNSLTRDNSAITIRDFLNGQVKNDCLPVVMQMSQELRDVHQQFSEFSSVYLTGTGSSMFAKCSTRQEAVSLSDQLPESWTKWVVKGINESPLQKSLKQFFNRANQV
ncbi:MAG: 4-(cytidine 5'-diphospho)-2-C-methyl-D-erythritol kinase [Cycloclasticus sp.]|nr:4-(cytidine 5'-diphospho)-2-C-methyl-D-erythritol kinase [Cycloclasticus sp.]